MHDNLYDGLKHNNHIKNKKKTTYSITKTKTQNQKIY